MHWYGQNSSWKWLKNNTPFSRSSVWHTHRHTHTSSNAGRRFLNISFIQVSYPNLKGCVELEIGASSFHCRWNKLCTAVDTPPMLCTIYSFHLIPSKTCTRTKVLANIYPLHCVESMKRFFSMANIKLLSILSSSLRNKDCEFAMNCSGIESVYSNVNAEPSCQTSKFFFRTQYSRESI